MPYHASVTLAGPARQYGTLSSIPHVVLMCFGATLSGPKMVDVNVYIIIKSNVYALIRVIFGPTAWSECPLMLLSLWVVQPDDMARCARFRMLC